MILTFAFTVMGFIIPCFLVFVTEVDLRKKFVLARASQKINVGIHRYAMNAIKVAVTAFVAAVVGTWFCLSSARDHFY